MKTTDSSSATDDVVQAIEATRRAYDNTAEAYHKLTGAFHRQTTYPHIVRLLTQQMGTLAGKSILDAGCGSGDLMQRLTADGGVCEGVDLSSAFVAMAQRQNLQVCQGSIHELPHEADCFDAGVANYVLPYLPPAGQYLALRELHRVLRPGGVVVISVMHPFLMRMSRHAPDQPHYQGVVDSYFEPQTRITMSFSENDFTLYLMDWPEMFKLATVCGFTVRELFDPPPPPDLESIAAALPNDQLAEMVRSFAFDPYAAFLMAVKI